MIDNIFKMRLKTYILISLITGSVFNTQAQNVFGLKQAVQYALEHHGSVEIGENNVQSAHHRVREGYAPYLPQVNGNFGLDDNLKLQTNVIPAGTFGPDPIKIRFGQQYNGNVAFQLDQKLYDQSLINGFKGFKASKELAAEQLNKSKEDVAYDVAVSYLKVLINREQLKLIQNNENTYKKLFEITQLQKEKGVIKQTDLDRIKVAYNNIVSQKALAQDAIMLAENSLKVSMGLSLTQPITLADTSNIDKSTIESGLNSGFDIKKRSDFRILEKNVYLQNVVLKQIRGMYIPTLSAYARYGALALNNDFAKMWGTWYDFSTIGLKLNIPIFDGFTKDARARQQKLVVENQKKSLEIYTEQFKLQNENARLQMNRSKIQLENTKANLSLAQSVFEQTSLQYQLGAATLSDFLNAENAFKEAQINYINTLYNYKQSRLDLEKSAGSILEFINNQ
jgi:outer membrane protein TolC